MASLFYEGAHSIQIIPDDRKIYKYTKDKDGKVTEVKLRGKNTWKDWHLVPTSRPLINPPAVKTNYIEIPGADGAIDVTELLTKRVNYNNRGGSIEFYVANGYGDWATRYSEIMEYLHGQLVKIVLQDDPGYYYRGRLAVNQWKSEKDFSRIVFDYNVEPYKYNTLTTLDDWLWDPFNFYTGIIRKKENYQKVTVSGSDTWPNDGDPVFVDMLTDYMPETPTITIRPQNIAWWNDPVHGGDDWIPSTLFISVCDTNDPDDLITYGTYSATFENKDTLTVKPNELVLTKDHHYLRFLATWSAVFEIDISYRGGRL